MDRHQVLEQAMKVTSGQREQDHGKPENNFSTISQLWSVYLAAIGCDVIIDAVDVAVMMGLLKIARIASGRWHDDNFVDLAGYAALAGEMAAVALKADAAEGGVNSGRGKV